MIHWAKILRSLRILAALFGPFLFFWRPHFLWGNMAFRDSQWFRSPWSQIWRSPPSINRIEPGLTLAWHPSVSRKEKPHEKHRLQALYKLYISRLFWPAIIKRDSSIFQLDSKTTHQQTKIDFRDFQWNLGQTKTFHWWISHLSKP